MTMVEQLPLFEHEPLDITQQSIRLISIDPALSPEGLVQSTIHHATIDARYNCLSYRWGSVNLSHTILINGKRFSVNQNLHDFLEAVRTFQKAKQHLRGCLWIDAVCINQTANKEKNQQVAQMGKIYSNARKVIMWLGKSPNAGRRSIFESKTQHYMQFIFYNKYWTRTWIAQEVLLAQDPVLMVDDQLIPFRKLVKDYWGRIGRLKLVRRHWKRRLLMQPPVPDRYEAAGVLWACVVYLGAEGKNVKRHGIIYWLDILRDVDCNIPNDRVFSILELAREGSRIPVDYTMPLVELAYHILMVSSNDLCLCQVALLILLLGIKEEATDCSIPCGYVQLEKTSPVHCGVNRNEAERGRLAARFETWDDDHGTILQIFLTEFAEEDFTIGGWICSGAAEGKPSIPVKVGRGLIRDRWKVSGDVDAQNAPPQPQKSGDVED